jgi:hypothetical protein
VAAGLGLCFVALLAFGVRGLAALLSFAFIADMGTVMSDEDGTVRNNVSDQINEIVDLADATFWWSHPTDNYPQNPPARIR